jgi:uncharacterized protein (TIGR03435 family)
MTRLAAMLVTVSSISVAAAQQTAPTIQFEVASVKVNASGDTTSYGIIPPAGRVSMTNAELRDIITIAFQLSRQTARFTLAGGTELIMRTRFDISAKPPDDALPGQAPAMLRALLTQRFGLQTHRETRDIPVYALKLANTGRFGPRFRPSQHNCDEWVKAVGEANSFILGNGVREPSDATGKSWCRSNPFDRDGISARGAGTIAQLIRGVQGFTDRLVIDMTGLAGNFEWDVKFVRSSLGDGVTRGPNVPEMFTAFREQLGLTLEPRIAPHDVLVIQRVEMPTPD